eukprot:7994016-Pyramimonas_sp.AAC.1
MGRRGRMQGASITPPGWDTALRGDGLRLQPAVDLLPPSGVGRNELELPDTDMQQLVELGCKSGDRVNPYIEDA